MNNERPNPIVNNIVGDEGELPADEIGLTDSPQLVTLDPSLESEVYKVVKDINISKSSGITNISSYILKESSRFYFRRVLTCLTCRLAQASSLIVGKKHL